MREELHPVGAPSKLPIQHRSSHMPGVPGMGITSFAMRSAHVRCPNFGAEQPAQQGPLVSVPWVPRSHPHTSSFCSGLW